MQVVKLVFWHPIERFLCRTSGFGNMASHGSHHSVTVFGRNEEFSFTRVHISWENEMKIHSFNIHTLQSKELRTFLIVEPLMVDLIELFHVCFETFYTLPHHVMKHYMWGRKVNYSKNRAFNIITLKRGKNWPCTIS